MNGSKKRKRFDLLESISVQQPDLTADLLVNQYPRHLTLEMCALHPQIRALASRRGVLEKLNPTDEELNALGSPELAAAVYRPKITSKKELKKFAQQACKNSHDVLLKAFLRHFELDASFKSYELFIRTKKYSKAMLVLLKWRGKNGKRLYMDNRDVGDFFALYRVPNNMDIEIVSEMVKRLPDDLEISKHLLGQAVSFDRLDVVKVLTTKPQFELDLKLFEEACRKKSLSVLKYMLTEANMDFTMLNDTHYGANWHVSSLRLVLTDDRFNPNRIDFGMYPSEERLLCLIQHPRTTGATRTVLLYRATQRELSNVVEAALQREVANVSGAAEEALRLGCLHAARLLINDPRFTPTTSCLSKALRDRKFVEFIPQFVKHPDVDVTVNNYILLQSLLQWGKFELFKEMLQHPQIKGSLLLYFLALL